MIPRPVAGVKQSQTLTAMADQTDYGRRRLQNQLEEDSGKRAEGVMNPSITSLAALFRRTPLTVDTQRSCQSQLQQGRRDVKITQNYALSQTGKPIDVKRISMKQCLFAVLIAIAYCQTATAEDLTSADRLFKAGKWELARNAYEAALDGLTGNDEARVLRQIGYTWQITHYHEKALPYFDRVLTIEGIDAEHRSGALLRRGYSLRLLKRGHEGIAALDKAAAVEGAPANHVAEALLYAAWEHNSRDEQEPAIRKFRRIASIDGVHSNYVATAQLSIGRILQNQQRYTEAITEFRSIASLNPVAAVNRARARVYILECEALLAGDTPFHIKPYVSKVTTDSARVFWVSQGEIPAGKIIFDNGKSQMAAEVETVALHDTVCHLHSALLSDLEPKTRYSYEVECGGQQVSGTFTTAPQSGSPFSFCLIGDTQSYHEGLQPLLEAMAEEPTDFVLHVGDITDRGNLWGEWKASFFDPGRSYLKRQTLWPVYGNHDGGPYFPALFDLRKQYWYSFNWGDAHFIVLDSYGAGSGGPGRKAQLAWLAKDLEANNRRWTFVALHVPMIATRRSLKWFGDDDFLPLLEEHGVDVVFSGHHPHYRRYRPIGTRGRKPILHITSGGGGGPVGGYVPSPLLAQGINVNHYCRIQVSADRLQLTAHAISGAVIDRFEILKEGEPQLTAKAVATNNARQLISLYQELVADRTFELRLFVKEPPKPGEAVDITLDLSRLPRGPLDPQQFADDEVLTIESTKNSVWKVTPQSFQLQKGVGVFHATAPASISINGHSIKQSATLRLQLKKGERAFEPFNTTARFILDVK